MEIHLFIIWEKAQNKKNDILEDIKKDLEIIKVIDVTWKEERFIDNLSRFYGKKLPSGSQKIAECGKGTFTVVVVNDTHPVYKEKKTSHGMEKVNINIFERKEKYRNWTNDETTPANYHGSRVHGTNNEEETRHDLTSLFGVSPKDLLENPNVLPECWTDNIVGLEGWKSLNELFYVLNEACDYVVLRNHEYLPYKFKTEEHGDIDILTNNIERMIWVMGGEKVYKSRFRVHYKVKVDNDYVYFDFRHMGDGYYCKEWEEKMLSNKVYSAKGFYILNSEDYKYSILYHALNHKRSINNDYKNKLYNLFDNSDKDYYIDVLKKYLIEHNYYVSRPKDLSVFINSNNAGISFGIKRRIYYQLAKIDKKLFNRRFKI